MIKEECKHTYYSTCMKMSIYVVLPKLIHSIFAKKESVTELKMRSFSSKKINQGTVIYGIKCEKYPSSACYGVIISARCDIAQSKVAKYYYLIAVDATKWLQSDYGWC